jgi:ribosomal-protein-alanine N-acetyltransferase
MASVINAPFYVRLMEDEDLSQVMSIEQASYEYCWTEKIFQDCRKAGYVCLVLADHDTVSGYAVLMVAPHEAHVLNVCIAPKNRACGWARHMMLEMIDIATRANCDDLFLEVRPSNPTALGLYQSLGFNEVGLRPNYYKSNKGREDAIVMALPLSLLNFSG